ncbi:MAG: 1,6-anhydro-N-acetylmuramyl-L-alanine amidase AmpD [Pseudomonadota bacterium]|nr:1,6-anhydro-N-acetylmuramyl-L-alanine amidase AmpD [Pseudomonadota bacterium]
MDIMLPEGILRNVRQIVSPNYNDRPLDTAIDLLVIHNISLPPGEFGTSAVVDFFCNQLETSAHPGYADLVDLKVSAHVFIRRDGEIIQFVPFNKRAWHAGKSHFAGREGCNDYSIGIELEGTDNLAYTINQYHQLAAVSNCLMRVYPGIMPQRIVGHVDIAPTRKTDPGQAFDWSFYRGLLVKE